MRTQQEWIEYSAGEWRVKLTTKIWIERDGYDFEFMTITTWGRGKTINAAKDEAANKVPERWRP